VCRRDEGVGVRGVAHDQHPHVVGGTGVDGLSLRLEDAAVRLEQVAALHAGRARPGAHQQRHVDAVERRLRVVGDVDALSSGKAQSSSSIAVPSAALSAGVISSSRRCTGTSGPNS
jgi:hypothetical protein